MILWTKWRREDGLREQLEDLASQELCSLASWMVYIISALVTSGYSGVVSYWTPAPSAIWKQCLVLVDSLYDPNILYGIP